MVPKHESQTSGDAKVPGFVLNLRQVIASTRGKELLQVTRLTLDRSRSGLRRTASFEVSDGTGLAFVIDLKL